MKRQTVLEYLREREERMQEKICPYCEAHLDVEEKCTCRESQGLAEYTYLAVKENAVTGEQGKRIRRVTKRRPLEVNGLYMHLGKGYHGAYRILKLVQVK